MDLFNSNTADQVKLEDLVGEGKKYKDVNELAKAKAHADAHIARLEAENAQKAKELETRITVEDALKKLQVAPANGGTNDNTNHQATQTQTSEKANLTLEDIDKLLEEKERAKARNLNLNNVNAALLKYAGSADKAKEFLAAKAAETNISVNRLKEIGEESPAALLKLLGIADKPSTTPVTPLEKATNVIPPNKAKKFDLDAPMTSEDYRELRRTNPALYNSPEVQQKLLRDKMAELKKKQ